MSHKVFSPLCFCLLAACSNLPAGPLSPIAGDSAAASASPAEAAISSDDSRLVLEAIVLAQRVANASVDEQRQEMTAAAKAVARERTTGSRLRYGVLLSLPALVGADPQRAVAVLEPLSTGAMGPVRQFATLIVWQLNERVKEQRRAQLLKEQLDETRASERVLSERAGQLKIQLDELRAVERTLIERGQPRK